MSKKLWPGIVVALTTAIGAGGGYWVAGDGTDVTTGRAAPGGDGAAERQKRLDKQNEGDQARVRSPEVEAAIAAKRAAMAAEAQAAGTNKPPATEAKPEQPAAPGDGALANQGIREEQAKKKEANDQQRSPFLSKRAVAAEMGGAAGFGLGLLGMFAWKAKKWGFGKIANLMGYEKKIEKDPKSLKQTTDGGTKTEGGGKSVSDPVGAGENAVSPTAALAVAAAAGGATVMYTPGETQAKPVSSPGAATPSACEIAFPDNMRAAEACKVGAAAAVQENRANPTTRKPGSAPTL